MLVRTLPTCVFWSMAAVVVTALAEEADTTPGAPSTESQLFARAAYHLMEMLHRPAIQKDLHLDADQQAPLAELSERMQTDRQAANKRRRETSSAELSKDQRRQNRQAMHTEHVARLRDYHQALTRILTREQLARLKQLYWQDIGPVVFRDDEICTALSLTQDQRREIAALAESLREAEALRAEERYLAEHPRPSGFVFYRATTEYKQRSVERLSELLHPIQVTKLHELLGAECPGAAIPAPPFEVIPVASRCEANPRD